jgi:Leucine-rich repeat (LRR) protein
VEFSRPAFLLTSLTVLSLYNNQIMDISAVAGLTKLTQLNLGSNLIGEASAVSGLTK